MGSAQDLRKRIKSVTNTQQITKAMKMVASARLRRAQSKAKATEPYANKLKSMLEHASVGIDRADGPHSHPLLGVRTVNKTAYVVIGADKGLAGAYTSTLLKYTVGTVANLPKEAYTFVSVGKKPYEYFKHHNYPLQSNYGGFSDKPEYEHAVAIVKEITDLFLSEAVDKVVMIYTHFVNSLTQTVQSQQLLPVEPSEHADTTTEYLFVPSREEVFSQLLPKYLECTVYNALLHASASELGARMTAMTSATDNAGELIGTLNLEYNKLRQAGITNEISEIVGGANALQ